MTTTRDLQEWYEGLKVTHPEMVGQREPSRPRSARGYWHPVIARLYGIRPWEMGQLTLREVRAISDDVELLAGSQ